MNQILRAAIYIPTVILLAIPIIYSIQHPEQANMEVFLRFWWVWVGSLLYGAMLGWIGLILKARYARENHIRAARSQRESRASVLCEGYADNLAVRIPSSSENALRDLSFRTPSYNIITPGFNEDAETQLVISIFETVKEALNEDVTPTHVGVHPDDLKAMQEAQILNTQRVLYYYRASEPWITGFSLQLVPDKSLERNTANVVTADSAFVAGYIDKPPDA